MLHCQDIFVSNVDVRSLLYHCLLFLKNVKHFPCYTFCISIQFDDISDFAMARSLLIFAISQHATSAAITIAEPHAFGLIHPPEVIGVFVHHDDIKDDDDYDDRPSDADCTDVDDDY